MKLLKIILFIFFVYFIRRFFQMYKVMKEVQRQQDLAARPPEPAKKDSTDKKVVDADFKIIDR